MNESCIKLSELEIQAISNILHDKICNIGNSINERLRFEYIGDSEYIKLKSLIKEYVELEEERDEINCRLNAICRSINKIIPLNHPIHILDKVYVDNKINKIQFPSKKEVSDYVTFYAVNSSNIKDISKKVIKHFTKSW